MEVTEYQYEYGLSIDYNKTLFKRQCDALEEEIKGLEKQELLIDVDDAQIQLYTLDGKKITVINDNFFFGGVHVKSQIDLETLGIKLSAVGLGRAKLLLDHTKCMAVTEYKYYYSLCMGYSAPVFKEQCRILEEEIKGLEKSKLLTDADENQAQPYTLDGKEIQVVNDRFLGEVYVKSQIDLETLGIKPSSVGQGRIRLLLKHPKDTEVTKYNYDYSLGFKYDKLHFKKQCESLEEQIKGLEKEELFIDVDGSQIQNYSLNGKKIKVLNEKAYGEVSIKSQVDLKAMGVKIRKLKFP